MTTKWPHGSQAQQIVKMAEGATSRYEEKRGREGGEVMEKIGHVVNQRTDVNFFNLLPFRQPETLVSESGSYRLLYAGAGDRAWDKTAGERGTVGEGGRKFSSDCKI